MKRIYGLLALLPLAVGLQAATISFTVSVNTSAIPTATPGFIDLQFNQANTGALSGTAAISGFTSSGFTFDNTTNNFSTGVTGALRNGNLVLPNDVGASNYFDQGVTNWGGGFSFIVTFSGPLVGATNATDPSGFYVSLYDSAFNALGATLSQGETANLIFNTDGSISPNVSADSRIALVSSTPEPSSLVLGGIAGLLLVRRRLRK